MYTGIHTVSPATLASPCERTNPPYLSIYLGAVFADLQFFPDAGAGAHHASECKLRTLAFLLRQRRRHHSIVPILFGTFNRSTATDAEAELSYTFQTAFANFVKDPTNPPVPNWPPYEPELSGDTVAPTLAKIAYDDNVYLNDFIELVQPNMTVSMRILGEYEIIYHWVSRLCIKTGYTVRSVGPVP